MKQYLCIGTYTEEILFGTGELLKGKGKGVSIATFEDGIIEIINNTYVMNSSFLVVDDKIKKIYAVNEAKEYLGKYGGGVTQLSYDSEGNMQVEATFNAAGTDPCHIIKSPDFRFLVLSNFADGSVSIFYLDEQGNMTGDMDLFQHEGNSIHPIRQKGPHAHSAIFTPDGNYMYIPDLGIDTLKAYEISQSRVKPITEKDVAVPSGSGPRYGEFDQNGKHFYLINELASQVMHFTYEEGKLIRQETVNTLPEDFKEDNICSDLHLTPDGKYLYASNRGHDSIVCYAIGEKGELSFVQRISSGGKTPRNFCIDPTGKYVLVGNQDSDNITVFAIGEDGQLSLERQYDFGTPVCIRFFNMNL